MSDTTEPAASRHPRRSRRLTIAALAAAGLASGAAITGTAANASGSGSGSSSASSTQQSAPSTAPKPPGKGGRPATPKPHLDGTVTSVAGQTITITDHEGFSRIIKLSSSTTFVRDGKTVTESAVVAGRFVHADGSVDSNKTSLDATSVVVMASAPKPGAGPGGRPRPGHRAKPKPAGKAPVVNGSKPTPPKRGVVPAAPGTSSTPSASPSAHGS